LLRALQAVPHSPKHVSLLPSLQTRLESLQLTSRSDISAAYLHAIVESIQLHPQLKSSELLRAAEAAFEAYEKGLRLGFDQGTGSGFYIQTGQRLPNQLRVNTISTNTSTNSTVIASSMNRVFANFITVLG